MSGKHVDRVAERRRILRAIGRSGTRHEGDREHSDLDDTDRDEEPAPSNRREPSLSEVAAMADTETGSDGPDGQQTLANGGATESGPADAALLELPESERGE